MLIRWGYSESHVLGNKKKQNKSSGNYKRGEGRKEDGGNAINKNAINKNNIEILCISSNFVSMTFQKAK